MDAWITWRVATWNVHGSANPSPVALARVLRDLRPDVVALQEVRRGLDRRLVSELGWQTTWARKHSPFTPLLPWRDEGLAIVSPHRLEEVAHRSIAPGVSTWSHRHRIVLAATVVRGTDRLRLFDVHLASSPTATDERIAQAGRVVEYAASTAGGGRPGAVRVIAGDLNARDEPEVIRAFHPAGVRDPGGGFTNPAIAPRQRLDYLLLPEGAEVTARVEVDGGEEWAELSDHLPVLVEFRCAPSTGAAPSP